MADALLLLPLPAPPLPYAQAKALFHKSNAGLPLPALYLHSLPALTSLLLYCSYPAPPAHNPHPHPPPAHRRPWTTFTHDYALLVIPLVLGLTWGAQGWWALLNLVLLARAGLLRLGQQSAVLRAPPPAPQEPSTPAPRPPERYHYPPLTTYRAHLMLMTLLSILAVDFPAFPRALGKTTARGWSLMDIGVGSFVLSGGLAAARSLAPGVRGGALGLGKTLRRQLPLLALALGRVLAVKALRYPEQIEEYGAHWNFFCTLFLLPLLCLPLRPVVRWAARRGGAGWAAAAAAALAGGVTAAHQLWLDGGVGSWALGEDREGLLAMNKEGVVSLPGYLAIYLLGTAIGLLLPLSLPREGEPPPGSVLGGLAPLLSVLAAAFSAASYCTVGGGPSRRLANTQYVLHTGVYNLVFLCAYILLDAWYFPPSTRAAPPSASPAPGPPSGQSSALPPRAAALQRGAQRTPAPSAPSPPPPSPRTPPLFAALNRHPLAVFLLANLLTGCINLAIPTMYVRDAPAVAIIAAYGALVCAVAWAWP